MTLFTMAETPERIEFAVFGDPAPQGSKTPVYRTNRVTGVRAPTGAMRESAGARLTAWRDQVTAGALTRTRGRVAYTVPVIVSLVVTVARPKSGPWANADWPGGDPDLDKLQRAVGDALTAGKVIADDALIVKWSPAVKVFTGARDLEPWALDRPGAQIRVRPA